ncbi:ABC transporter ATP-binding protein [Pantoea osteomyelitidis]|uniref:ABC transporter ATP-binding protein n=1 Tax=Pantoea osteomyelitidis TaxID=3230026 RepID=A0ABW7PXD7_9GAMM
MSNITVKNVGKAYKNYPSRFGRLIEWISPVKTIRHQKTWVLNDISFHVSPGEAVGIIGINGAGKSTLLKIITGTVQPTKGTVLLQGRVAALLELGMGFHPDFTGRQNAYMSGQLLGLTTHDIDRLMPEIEAFAEIGDYIDRPVRVYSSGMQMRLAFSVATAVRPDILIVDEALSVGDSYFQHKSFDRIRKFRSQGTTLLLVSHDKAAIQTICDRAILLNAGKIQMEGAPDVIMDCYNALLAEKTGENTLKQESIQEGKIQTVSGNGKAKINNISLHKRNGEKVEIVNIGEAVNLKVSVDIVNDIDELVMGYVIKDRLGLAVYGTNTYHLGKKLTMLKAGEKVNFDLNFNMNVGEGNYSISIALHDRDTHVNNNYEWRDLALIFNVLNGGKPISVGTSWLPTEVEIHHER